MDGLGLPERSYLTLLIPWLQSTVVSSKLGLVRMVTTVAFDMKIQVGNPHTRYCRSGEEKASWRTSEIRCHPAEPLTRIRQNLLLPRCLARLIIYLKSAADSLTWAYADTGMVVVFGMIPQREERSSKRLFHTRQELISLNQNPANRNRLSRSHLIRTLLSRMPETSGERWSNLALVEMFSALNPLPPRLLVYKCAMSIVLGTNHQKPQLSSLCPRRPWMKQHGNWAT